MAEQRRRFTDRKTGKVLVAPPMAKLEKWLNDGVAKASDGCTVEPDGRCEHGKRSWLLVLGYI